MTPEEKARELLLQYYSLIPMNTISFAKKCAIITVDELIYSHSQDTTDNQYYFWKEVKQEIEKL